MLFLLLFGLLLIATAVAFFARSIVAPRLRTAGILSKIDRYGFASVAEPEPRLGLRSFLDPAALGLGRVFADRLKLFDEARLRKQLLTAGMYGTPPRTIIGYSFFCAIAFPTLWVTIAVASGFRPALN